MSRNAGCATYAIKEETRVEGPWEFGTPPPRPKEKIDWAKVKKDAEESKFDDIPPEAYVKYHHSIHKIAVEKLKPIESYDVRGFWLWGPPGTGKTTYARTHWGTDVYVKA